MLDRRGEELITPLYIASRKTMNGALLLRHSYDFVACRWISILLFIIKGKGKGHPCTGTEALYRPYGT